MHIRPVLLAILFLLSVILPGAAQNSIKVITLSSSSFKEGYPARNLMDNNPKTLWQPLRDSLDEGVMIRFLSPSEISQIRVITDSKQPLILYVNGENSGSIEAGVSYPVNRRQVTTLYFKINTDSPVKIYEIYLNESGNPVQLLDSVQGTVQSSSILEPEIAYSPEMAFDNRLDYSWCEGTKSNGENEWIEIEFARKITLDTLYLANGYQAAAVHFKANTRVKEFQITADGGKPSVYTLKDQMGFQSVTLSQPVSAKKLRLTVISVYPGTKYTDMLISEIKFGNQGKIFDLQSDFLLRSSRKVADSFKGTLMEEILDRSLLFSWAPGPYEESLSITFKIRSQGDFEIWRRFSDGNGQDEEIVFDGSWNLVRQGSGRIEIKIFGRKYSTAKRVNWDDPYSNPQTTEETRLFSDFLTIKKADLSDIREEGAMAMAMKEKIRTSADKLFFISGKSMAAVFPASIP
jgi:hypothetical protein